MNENKALIKQSKLLRQERFEGEDDVVVHSELRIEGEEFWTLTPIRQSLIRSLPPEVADAFIGSLALSHLYHEYIESRK